MRNWALVFLFSLPLAAQSLSISCPPAKNKPQVCPIVFTGGASSLQWKMVASPAVNLTASSAVLGKSLVSNAGTYLLAGMNSVTITGQVALITIPAHSGNVTLLLQNVIGCDAKGHQVQVSPAVTVTVP